MSIKGQIKRLKDEIPEIEKIVSGKKFEEEEIGKLEYFISQVISIAEATPRIQNSTQFKRIRELQESNRYPSNMYILFPIIKGILETLENLYEPYV